MGWLNPLSAYNCTISTIPYTVQKAKFIYGVMVMFNFLIKKFLISLPTCNYQIQFFSS